MEIFKCRDYLMLPICFDKIYDLQVPSEGYKLLLEAVSNCDIINNYKLFALIKSNLPSNFDIIGVFSPELSDLLTIELPKIACLDIDNQFIIWDTKSNTHIYPLLKDTNTKSVLCIAAFSDGKRIALGCAGAVYIYDINTRQCQNIFNCKQFYPQDITSIVVSSDNKFLVICYEKKQVVVYDFNSRNVVCNFQSKYPFGCVKIIAISNDMSFIVVSDGSIIEIREFKSGFIIWEKKFSNVFDVIISKDNKKIIYSIDLEKTIEILDAVNHTLLATLKDEGGIYSIAISNNGKFIVSVGYNTITIWDAVEYQLIMYEYLKMIKLLFRLTNTEWPVYGVYRQKH